MRTAKLLTEGPASAQTSESVQRHADTVLTQHSTDEQWLMNQYIRESVTLSLLELEMGLRDVIGRIPCIFGVEHVMDVQ